MLYYWFKDPNNEHNSVQASNYQKMKDWNALTANNLGQYRLNKNIRSHIFRCTGDVVHRIDIEQLGWFSFIQPHFSWHLIHFCDCADKIDQSLSSANFAHLWDNCQHDWLSEAGVLTLPEGWLCILSLSRGRQHLMRFVPSVFSMGLILLWVLYLVGMSLTHNGQTIILSMQISFPIN